jgi:very-short-patch-repair endonuclease
MKDLAQENRENPTDAEAILWNCLGNKQLGVTFWRQHCVNANGHDYILDFYCKQLNLAVEIDGRFINSNRRTTPFGNGASNSWASISCASRTRRC